MNCMACIDCLLDLSGSWHRTGAVFAGRASCMWLWYCVFLQAVQEVEVFEEFFHVLRDG